MNQLFFVLVFLFSPHFAWARMDPSSPEVIKKEAKILKRILQISSGGGENFCTATWADDAGILITADHCVDYSVKTLKVNGIETRILDTARMPDRNGDARERVLNDVMLILVDPKPLKPLNLPKEPLALAQPRQGKIPAGEKLLIAGYGFQKIMVNAKGFPLAELLDEPFKLGANYVITSDAEENDIFELNFKSNRSVLVTAACKKGWTVVNPAGGVGCGLKINFSSAKATEVMISQGDSGGPAFRRNKANEWELLGISSMIHIIPHDTLDLKTVLVHQDGKEDPLEGRVTEDWFASLHQKIQDPFDSFVLHCQNLIIFAFEQNRPNGAHLPLPEDMTVKIKATGTLYGKYMNLAQPKLNQRVNTLIKALKQE